MKKDSLIRGTLILAAAALVARALGLFQRVPMEHVLSNRGDTYYGVANNIYLLLLVIATAGIPSAISKMVSERYALGRVDEARQVYRAALLFAAVAGVVITGVLIAIAPVIADNMMDRPGAAASIRAIAPALLLFPIIAMMRGYFQGRQLMSAGGTSQIVEQLVRVTAAIAIAFSLYGMGASDERIAAGASFGSVFGSIAAFAVMLYYGRKLVASDRESGVGRRTARVGSRKLKLGAIYRELFGLSLPIVFTSITVQFMFTLDSIMVTSLLGGHFHHDTVDLWSAVLNNRAQPIAGIPVILAVALGQSIIPIVSSAFAVNDHATVGRQASLAVRIAVFTAVPVIVWLTAGAYSVNALLFSSDEGSPIVALLTFSALFQIGMMVTNAILQGIGQSTKGMKHALVGIVVKLVLSFALAPWLGVYGILAATTACFLTTFSFNLMSLRKRTQFRMLAGSWTGYLATVAILAGVVWGLEWAVLGIMEGAPAKLAYFFAAAVMGAAIGLLYPALLVLLRVVGEEEARAYPAKVRKLLAPFFRLRRTVVGRG